ncbi:MAG: class I SAM-dependent methyltransferase [Pirellulaceae bacterium]
MTEINLLDRYPKTKRSVAGRLPDKLRNRELAGKFGREYFDGDRSSGYGGYRYDGRWVPIAKRFVEHWGLQPGDRVLDVGCAKGFLVKDLLSVCPGLDVVGIDVSQYAIDHAEPEVQGRLFRGDARAIPFPDGFFRAVISINALHNLEIDECLHAVGEVQRVAREHQYIQIDSYRTPEERQRFLDWQLTCKSHYYPDEWRNLLEQVGYTGEYYFTYVDD